MTKPTPNPQPLSVATATSLSIDNIEEYKQIYCAHYDACLWNAAMSRWPNFHCKDCAAFCPMDREKLVREGNRLDPGDLPIGKP